MHTRSVAAILVLDRAQSYVVGWLLRRIEESFVRAGRLRREWNGRSAGAVRQALGGREMREYSTVVLWSARMQVQVQVRVRASGKVQLQQRRGGQCVGGRAIPE